jgi:outer membrane protein assembly factor BamB
VPAAEAVGGKRATCVVTVGLLLHSAFCILHSEVTMSPSPFLSPIRGGAVVAAVVVLALAGEASMQTTSAWPQWRGPNRDGHSLETGLLQQWPAGGPPLAWKAAGAGAGYSSMVSSGGRLYTLGARAGTEYVVAFDAASGRKLWEVPNGRLYTNDRGDGPRSTPTLDGDRLFVLGASGDLSALQAADGKAVWSVNVFTQFGGRNPRWGLSESPLVAGDRVLVNAGGPDASIVALEKRTGKVLWRSQSDEAGYSSAVLHTVGGIEHAIFFTGQRAVGVDVRDGRLLWSYDKVANRVANIATPIVRGDRVFLSSDYGTGAALLRLQPSGTGLAAEEVYFTREMRNHHASSVLVDDHLYGFSSAILTALRFADGTMAWRDRSVGKGSIIYADKRLYLFGENGAVGLAEASPEGYSEKGRFSLQTGSLPTWAHPMVAGGRLFLRDQDTIYAYDVRAR